MAKALRDIVDKRLEGSDKSTVRPGSTGKDPGVDYMPKAPAEQDFVAQHKTQVFDDRAGNKDVPYTQPSIKQAILKPEEKRHGRDEKESKAAYKAANESTAKCNQTGLGVMCEVHGEKECPPGIEPKDVPKFGQKVLLDKKKSVTEEAEYIEEVLSASDPVSKWIHHFVHSDNPRFAGKSTKARQQMALGAYYKAKRGYTKEEVELEEKLTDEAKSNIRTALSDKMKKGTKSVRSLISLAKSNPANVKEDLAMPMLEGGKKKKVKKESAPGDTAITFPAGNVGDTGRV